MPNKYLIHFWIAIVDSCVQGVQYLIQLELHLLTMVKKLPQYLIHFHIVAIDNRVKGAQSFIQLRLRLLTTM